MKAESTAVLLPRTVFEAGADKDIELECTLADYLPNINRIIRASADIVCDDVQISGGKAEVSGKAEFTLLYESDFNGKLQCEKYSTDFTHRFDLKDLPEDELIPEAGARCSYVGCKTLNPRRFILRCRADITLEIKCMQSVPAVSMQDTEGAYFRSERHRLAVYNPRIVRDFSMEENIPLETMPPVGDIIYTSLNFSSGEITTAPGSAVIRAEADFRCLYEKEDGDGELQLAERRFPIVLTVDDDCLNEDSELKFKLSVKSIESEKDIDAYGENRVIILKYCVRAEIDCTNRAETDIPTDMFFEDYETENKLQDLPYEEPLKELRHRFIFEKIFEIPEMTIEKCMDVNADISISEAVLTDDGLSVKGNCGINVFGKSANGYSSYDCSGAFSEIIPFSAGEGGADCRFRISAEAQNPAADASGGRLSVRVPVQLCISAVCKKSLKALASAEIEKRADSDAEIKPIIIYYPQKGESAWDIGRRYHTNPAGISESNSEAFDKNGLVNADGVVLYM